MGRNEPELDLLAFGAHPDDVEIGVAGTLIKHRNMGKAVGLCTLTRAELSSNGTVDLRQTEAKKAADIMGVSQRVQLDFPDRGLGDAPDTVAKVTEIIRTYRPTIVLAPYWHDRHPDHEHTSRIVREAVFNAKIKKVVTENKEPKHNVTALYYYFINEAPAPQFVVDVSDEYSQKMKALSCYESQFQFQDGSTEKTVLNQGYLESVQARDYLFGKEQGIPYAEGFIAPTAFLTKNLC